MRRKIGKSVISMVLAAALMLSMAACGGGNGDIQTSGGNDNTATSHVISKGLFLLEPNEMFDLSAEEGLTAQEAYLIHIYDLIPDSVKNVDMNGTESSYTITLNDVNTYKSLWASKYGGREEYESASVQRFITASGYAAPTEIGTILAGGEPIRTMSVFIINKNDINDDTVVKFEVKDNEVFDSVLTFERKDIKTIDYFDGVFQVEENQMEYQMASSLYIRASVINIFVDRTLQNFGAMKNILASYYELGLLSDPMYVSSSANGSFIYGIKNEAKNKVISELTEEDYTLMPFDKEVLKEIYPELVHDFDVLEENAKLYTASVQAEDFDKNGNFTTQEAYDNAQSSLNAMHSASENILLFFDGKKANK